MLNFDEPTYQKVAHSAQMRNWTVPELIERHMTHFVKTDWSDEHFATAEAVWASQETDPLPDNFTELCEGIDKEPVWSSR
jgi:hypothetical protein